LNNLTQSNICVPGGPRLQVLSEQQCKEIHVATLEVLERTGVWLNEPEALEMLRDAGARVADSLSKNEYGISRRVLIPWYLVEEALRSAPEKVTIYNRDGKPAMILEGRKSYFGCNIDSPDYIDPLSGERRKTKLKDIRTGTIIVDNLENIDWILVAGLPVDVNSKYADRVAAKEVLTNTTKPIVFTCGDYDSLTDIVGMMQVIAGGPEQLRRKPIGLYLDEPISPLKHDPESLKRLLKAAEMEVPAIYVPMPMMGVTAPCTSAGSVLIGNIESLSGLVIHQLRRKGAPYIYGALTSTADMSQVSFNYGAPELGLMCTAIAEMSHYYNLPVWGTGGCADSNHLDAQASAEITFSLLTAALAGANLIHDIGLMSQGFCVAPESYILNDEIVSMVKQFMKGIEVDAKTLCVDLIDEIGPGGNFIDHIHTLDHFREMWMPRFFDRTRFEPQKERLKLDFHERARGQIKKILQEHVPKPLPDDVLEGLFEIEGKWRRRA